MLILNTVQITVHIVFLIGMIVLFIKLFGFFLPGKGKKQAISWILLRIAMLATIFLHVLAVGYAHDPNKTISLFDFAVWASNVAVFIWAYRVHQFHFFTEFKKELKK